MEGQESEDDEEYAQFNKNKNSKKVGRKPQWSNEATNDLIDIILDDNKLKEKLLLTNVKNSDYYNLVISELSQRCGQRNASFEYDIKQTREKFKRCINVCREAALKIKTSSGIKRFQEEKEYGPWFNNIYII